MSESSDDRPVLVTGATGVHGGAIVRALLADGRAVRALTRDLESARAAELRALNAELVRGDLLDAASLTAAMTGVSAVYAVTTPFSDGPDGEMRQGEQIIAAAGQTNVPWLILASVASADRATGIPHFESKWRIEQQLLASRISHTVVAPTYFYENLGEPADMIARGEIALPLSDSRPLQQVALADLGAVVAALLGHRQAFLGSRIEVAGDQPTPQQMADALSAAGERLVRYRQTGLEEVAARSPDLAAMYRFLEQTGYRVDIGALRERFPEIRWTSFAAWAASSVRKIAPEGT